MILNLNRENRAIHFMGTAFGRWLLTSCFFIDLSWSTSAMSSKFVPCPDVIFSLTTPPRVCQSATLLFGWTAPSNRSSSTSVCFFKGNNTLPHGCVSLPAPPHDPCSDVSSFMGSISVPPSLPFWASLVSQGGHTVRAMLASGDCDQTAASDWPLMPSTNKPRGCAIHARSDFMVILVHTSDATLYCHNGSMGQGTLAGMYELALTASQVVPNTRLATRPMASMAVMCFFSLCTCIWQPSEYVVTCTRLMCAGVFWCKGGRERICFSESNENRPACTLPCATSCRSTLGAVDADASSLGPCPSSSARFGLA
jgi:hypothetical protein